MSGKYNIVADALWRVTEVKISATADFPAIVEAQKHYAVLQSLRTNGNYTFREFPILVSTSSIYYKISDNFWARRMRMPELWDYKVYEERGRRVPSVHQVFPHKPPRFNWPFARLSRFQILPHNYWWVQRWSEAIFLKDITIFCWGPLSAPEQEMQFEPSLF